jgi:oligosaccharide repeat unit polymerase
MYSWVGLLGAHLIIPLGMGTISPSVLVIIVTGVIAFIVGGVVAPRAPAVVYESTAKTSTPIAFTLVATSFVAVVFAGFLAFRNDIEVAYGQSFDSMSFEEVRYAQSYLEIEGGLGAIAFWMGTVASCISVLGGIFYHRAWYLLVPVVLYFQAQSPARSAMLGLVVTTLAFYFYVRTLFPTTGGNRTKEQLVIAVVVLGAFLWYFISVGTRLGKDNVSSYSASQAWLPSFLVTPVFYFFSGVSALTVAVESGINPCPGGSGRTLFVIYRVLTAIFPSIAKPATICEFVFIPDPTNVYTCFGDAWFDFGPIGVVLLMGTFGFVLAFAHANAMRGNLGSCFVGAILINAMSATPLAFSVWSLGNFVLAVVGYAVFTLIHKRAVFSPKVENRYDTISSSKEVARPTMVKDSS